MPREILTIDEMARTIVGLKDSKVPGGDEIPAEEWKHRGDNLFNIYYSQMIVHWLSTLLKRSRN